MDAAVAMASRARDEFALMSLAGDARSLPIGDRSAGSSVCATGVLEYCDHESRVAVLRELARTTHVRSPIFVSVVTSRSPALGVAASAVDTWWQWAEPASTPKPAHLLAFDAVAAEMGDRAATYELLKRALPLGRDLTEQELVASFATARLEIVSLDRDGRQSIATWLLRSHG